MYLQIYSNLLYLFVLSVSGLSSSVTLCCDLFSNFHIKNDGRDQRICTIHTPTLYLENIPHKRWKRRNPIAIFIQLQFLQNHNMIICCHIVSLCLCRFLVLIYYIYIFITKHLIVQCGTTCTPTIRAGVLFIKVGNVTGRKFITGRKCAYASFTTNAVSYLKNPCKKECAFLCICSVKVPQSFTNGNLWQQEVGGGNATYRVANHPFAQKKNTFRYLTHIAHINLDLFINL